MRVPDANGLWKAHPEEPRLMVRREPTEVGGSYYRILPEGRLEGYDGFNLRVKKPKQGLDLNRNFPGNWRQEYEQLGAGPFPTSEPEVRAVAEFIVRHPNICGGAAFHTWAGVLLRPFDHLPDTEMHAEDLWHYQRVGAKGTELTGYPNISVYHEFRYHPKQVIGGAFDWIYDHLGMFSWVVEIWSPMREAGIDKYLYIDWFRDHPIGRRSEAFSLERGEARRGRARRLEAVCASGAGEGRNRRLGPLSRLRQPAAAIPRTRTGALSAMAPVAGAALAAPRAGRDRRDRRGRRPVAGAPGRPEYRLAAKLRQQAGAGAQGGAAGDRGDRAVAGGELVSGRRREELGQLEGKAYKHTGISFWPDYHVTDDRAKIEWVVRGRPGDRVDLVARHERAGTVRAAVLLT